jgi:hypothetical protein
VAGRVQIMDSDAEVLSGEEDGLWVGKAVTYVWRTIIERRLEKMSGLGNRGPGWNGVKCWDGMELWTR